MHEPPVIWPYPTYEDPGATSYDMNPQLLLDCGPTPFWDAQVRKYTVTLRNFEPRPGQPAEKKDLQDARLSPVRNTDGRRSSTCAAVVDAVEWYLRDAQRLNPEDRLSQQAMATLTKRATIKDEATSLFHALLRPKTYGMIRSKSLNQGQYTGSAHEFFEDAHKLAIADFVLLDYLDSLGATPNPEAWKAWMSHRGPVLVRVVPDGPFAQLGTDTFEKYQGPRFLSDHGEPATGQHAAVLVGYRTGKGGTTFRLRNSWGEKWGRGGYADVSEAYAAKAFTEAWGVHVGRTY